MRALEEAAAKEGGEEFARRVVAEARVGEEVSQTERILGEEDAPSKRRANLPSAKQEKPFSPKYVLQRERRSR